VLAPSKEGASTNNLLDNVVAVVVPALTLIVPAGPMGTQQSIIATFSTPDAVNHLPVRDVALLH
jgi:hypothetical protein